MIKKIGLGILIFLGIGLFLFYVFQEKLIFLNGKKIPKDYVYLFPQSFEEVNLITEDNKTINALHFKLEAPKGVILFFHGNKGNLQRWGTIVPYLLAYNYEVLVMDYRGYGKSSGSFDEEKMYSDGLLAYDYLKKKYSENQIVVYGRSMGTTFATRVAAENNPKHVILEAPFYNLKRATQYYFTLSPTFLVKYKFRTDIDIPKVTSAITFFHGDDDATTSFEQSKELFQLVKSQQKEFVPIPTGTHHNLKDFDLYKSILKEILSVIPTE
ncbi:MAG: alpha/beta hydrolase [Flavobacteriaceae bacterium]|nr:alpha/beta hydrolase [Flavobacteriaceae bacterium]